MHDFEAWVMNYFLDKQSRPGPAPTMVGTVQDLIRARPE